MKITPRTALAVVLTVVLTSLVVGLSTAGAHDPVVGVEPASIHASLAPGSSITETKTVHTLAIPPLVDIVLVEDETGSFADDIANLQTLAGPGGALITALDATGANYATGVVGFRDFAQDIWGSPADWVYRRLADLAPGGSGFIAGVPLLGAGGGLDGPEAQLEALHYLADPAHAGIDSNGDGDLLDANDTVAGQQPSWRPGATRVALLATDNACHVTGDAGGWPGDAGTTSPATTAGILAAAGITVIGLTPGGLGFGCVDTLAAGTGGTVEATTSSGSDVADAIMAGLGNLAVDVTPSAVCDPGLELAFAPASRTVTSGDDAVFAETVSVDPAAPQGTTLTCVVRFLVDGEHGGEAFTQRVSVDVIDVTGPRAACVETHNPDGANVPTAGTAGGSGQNRDGFYRLRARDNVDADPRIYIGDTGSPAVFGPFPTGTDVKLTQAPGATPRITPMTGAVEWHVRLKGDMLVWAIDSSGNAGPVASCRVPPAPA